MVNLEPNVEPNRAKDRGAEISLVEPKCAPKCSKDRRAVFDLGGAEMWSRNFFGSKIVSKIVSKMVEPKCGAEIVLSH